MLLGSILIDKDGHGLDAIDEEYKFVQMLKVFHLVLGQEQRHQFTGKVHYNESQMTTMNNLDDSVDVNKCRVETHTIRMNDNDCLGNC